MCLVFSKCETRAATRAVLGMFEQHQSRSLVVWSAMGTLYSPKSVQFDRAEPKVMQHLTSEKSEMMSRS